MRNKQRLPRDVIIMWIDEEFKALSTDSYYPVKQMYPFNRTYTFDDEAWRRLPDNHKGEKKKWFKRAFAGYTRYVSEDAAKLLARMELEMWDDLKVACLIAKHNLQQQQKG